MHVKDNLTNGGKQQSERQCGLCELHYLKDRVCKEVTSGEIEKVKKYINE